MKSMDEGAVVLCPPIEVMRPKSVGVLPSGSEWIFQTKLDGFRSLAFVLEDHRVVLQSRAGRNLAPEFPELRATLSARLPQGLVLDGEICAATPDGVLAFHELLRTHRTRAQRGISVSFIAFDLLAYAGVDYRGTPLGPRLDLLQAALADCGPAVQPVLSTTDRQEALDWYEGLVSQGVEGIVAKDLRSLYSPSNAGRTWLKLRHTETQDAALLGLLGPQPRPRALLVQLADGRQEVTSPRLDALQARQVAEAIAADPGETRSGVGDGDSVHLLRTPLPIEVTVGSGRHGTVRFVRLRTAD